MGHEALSQKKHVFFQFGHLPQEFPKFQAKKAAKLPREKLTKKMLENSPGNNNLSNRMLSSSDLFSIVILVRTFLTAAVLPA